MAGPCSQCYEGAQEHRLACLRHPKTLYEADAFPYPKHPENVATTMTLPVLAYKLRGLGSKVHNEVS